MDVADMCYAHYLRHRLYPVLRWRGFADDQLADAVELLCARTAGPGFPGTDRGGLPGGGGLPGRVGRGGRHAAVRA